MMMMMKRGRVFFFFSFYFFLALSLSFQVPGSIAFTREFERGSVMFLLLVLHDGGTGKRRFFLSFPAFFFKRIMDSLCVLFKVVDKDHEGTFRLNGKKRNLLDCLRGHHGCCIASRKGFLR